MDVCYITTVTMTLAMKAKRLLEKNGIAASVSRLPPKLTAGGCAWGVSIDCRQAGLAQRILNSAAFSYGKFLRADGTAVQSAEQRKNSPPSTGVTGRPNTYIKGGEGR